MKTVATILRAKAEHQVYTVGPSDSVREAAEIMADRNIGALLVVDEGEVVGILSERDCARRMVLSDESPRATPVSSIMSAPVQYVRPSHTNEECMALMTDKRLRHLPVIDEGRLVGLISIGDLVKDIISEQTFLIMQLEHYITGDRW